MLSLSYTFSLAFFSEALKRFSKLESKKEKKKNKIKKNKKEDRESGKDNMTVNYGNSFYEG